MALTNQQFFYLTQLAHREMRRTTDSFHNLAHVERVRKNALRIAAIFGLEKSLDINLLQTACLLHDLTYVAHRPGLRTRICEGRLVNKKALAVLEKVGVGERDKATILRAVVNHPHSFPLQRLHKDADVYTKILQDADTLDIFHPARMRSFRSVRRKFLAYRLLSPFSIPLFNYGRKNLEKFLNFPELAASFFGQKIRAFSFLEFGRGNAETILCLHGYADSASIFEKLGNFLQSRYHVLALDFPMIHDQKKPQSLGNLVSYVQAFVQTQQLKTFTLVGYSLGGLVAIGYARAYRYNVDRLYLLNSLPQLIPSRTQQNLYRVLKPFLATKTFCRTYSVFARNRSLRRLRKIPVVHASILERMRTHAVSVFGTLFRTLDVSLTDAFNALSIPKCIVLFRDDEILRLKRYKRLLPLLNCDLVFFDRGGHASKNTYWKNVHTLWGPRRKL